MGYGRCAVIPIVSGKKINDILPYGQLFDGAKTSKLKPDSDACGSPVCGEKERTGKGSIRFRVK